MNAKTEAPGSTVRTSGSGQCVTKHFSQGLIHRACKLAKARLVCASHSNARANHTVHGHTHTHAHTPSPAIVHPVSDNFSCRNVFKAQSQRILIFVHDTRRVTPTVDLGMRGPAVNVLVISVFFHDILVAACMLSQSSLTSFDEHKRITAGPSSPHSFKHFRVDPQQLCDLLGLSSMMKLTRSSVEIAVNAPPKFFLQHATSKLPSCSKLNHLHSSRRSGARNKGPSIKPFARSPRRSCLVAPTARANDWKES